MNACFESIILIKIILELGHIVSPNSWSHWTVDSLCINASLRYDSLIDEDENGGTVYVAINECLSQYKHKCFIDDRCWNLMTEPGLQHYNLSHQLMFIMLAEKVSFFNKELLSNQAKGSY